MLPPDSTAQPRVMLMRARRAGEFRRSAAGPRKAWSASRTATCVAFPAKRRRTAARLQENIIRHSRSYGDFQKKIQFAPGIVNQGRRFICSIHCGHFRHR